MITPGLARIERLLAPVQLPWRAIHVAGTNGKGSICAYLASMLHAAGVRTGRFTSPHLIDRWDSVTLGDAPVNEALFRGVEAAVQKRDVDEQVGASEFERLTATAFEIFTRQRVEMAVIEAGMGGRFDATNVLRDPLVTVISKIGMDHQSFLGRTIEEIAHHKAGIIKPGVPWVVDDTNPAEALGVLTEYATSIGAGPCIRVPGPSTEEIWDVLCPGDFEPHQRVNLSCATAAFQVALDRMSPPSRRPPPISRILAAARGVEWPGRLQRLSLEDLTGRKEDVLLDGAHNPQSAEVLASYVDTRLRSLGGSVTWVLAASRGKDLGALFSTLVRAGDHVVAVEFGPVDGMPWVRAAGADDILAHVPVAAGQPPAQREAPGPDLLQGLQRAAHLSAGQPLVIAGSLYLAGDVLRLIRRSRGRRSG